ncbi:hypothetical protein ABC304_07725 [Microbacterium sp. 1P10UB]|uniref:hypothetical protein n=1 Tax=unclassified Microbacterium TaxID=2609290 RepID=UPI00399F4DF4
MSGDDGSARPDRQPQDIFVNVGADGTPDLSEFDQTVSDYADAYAEALASEDFRARTAASWGLVARGKESLSWVRAGLTSSNMDWVEDAGGVLSWIGATRADLRVLRPLLRSLPDGEARDVVAMVIDVIQGPEPGVQPPPPSQLLLDGEFDRFTEAIWYVNAPFDVVAQEMTAWLTDLGNRTFTPIHLDLPNALDQLEPWRPSGGKQLLVQTDSNWTAIFSQSGDGLESYEYVGGRLGVSRVRTAYSPHIVRDRAIINYGGCAFWYRAGDGTPRSLQASYQSRWDWDAYGEPLAFEDQDLYTAKKVADRFTLSTLNGYCLALGIRRNDPSFYLPNALLIEEHYPATPGLIGLTKSQWLSEYR